MVYLATMQRHQALGNRQPETGPAKSARDAGVGLLELLKKARPGLFAHADSGVRDAESPTLPDSVAGDSDAARRGELDRVPQQVGHDLLQPKRVAEGPGRLGHRRDQEERLAVGELAHGDHD